MDFYTCARCISPDHASLIDSQLKLHRPTLPSSVSSIVRFPASSWPAVTLSFSPLQLRGPFLPVVSASGGGDNYVPPGGRGGAGNGNGDEQGNDDEEDKNEEGGEEDVTDDIRKGEKDITENRDSNKEEAMKVLAEEGRELESLPSDLAAAIEDGKLPGSVVKKFFELEKSGWIFKWLMQFGPFKERLLADDLFLAKVAMECGVGVFTKTAAEYERRRENFFKEIEIVTADVVMAIIADFMLVYLPAPTVALRRAPAMNAGPIAKFFFNCPDNAFQVALAGTSYSLVQRLGAIVRNGAKLFAVGTASSLVGTSLTNIFINAKKSLEHSSGEEVENVPIFSTSFAYGLYMSVSSNLRYQIVAGVIEQRMLEPFLHNQKLLLSAFCFAVRTGNTFLGSLLWVDYARLVGIQKSPDEHVE